MDTVPLPSVEPGYLLIKVKAAAVNPSDVYSLRGTYSTTGEDVQYPISGGFEGSGVVIGHGGGIMGHMMLGQRVAFAMQGGGSYAEYAVVSVDKALPLPHELPYEQGAFSLVNPMTAVGMLSTGLSEGHNAFVQTAAASSLGKMLIRLCKAQGVNLISIVRREEQRKLLIRRGAPAEHVLVSTGAAGVLGIGEPIMLMVAEIGARNVITEASSRNQGSAWVLATPFPRRPSFLLIS